MQNSIPPSAPSFDCVVERMSDCQPGICADRTKVVGMVERGEFLKPCPGTGGGYLCCGYHILTPVTGCAMLCDYCILQTYFEHRCQVVFTNFDDLADQVHRWVPTRSGVIRLGTGEFADSLLLEKRIGMCRRVADLLSAYPNVLVEFKTKRPDLDAISSIGQRSRVVIGFSMNTEEMIALHEQATAPLHERLHAIGECIAMGFWVAIHFDPMFWYPSWENDYRQLTRRIFEVVRDPSRIAWWSMGGFRTVVSLKSLLARQGRHRALFSGELLRGDDGKLRYFRPIRTAFYRAVHDEVTKAHPSTTLYLCMESREVWEGAGMINRIPHGLPGYLDQRASTMLGCG